MKRKVVAFLKKHVTLQPANQVSSSNTEKKKILNE